MGLNYPQDCRDVILFSVCLKKDINQNVAVSEFHYYQQMGKGLHESVHLKLKVLGRLLFLRDLYQL